MSATPLRSLRTALCVLLLAPAYAGAQEGSALTGATDPFYRHKEITAEDSIDIWRAVRSRQFRFERIKRANFPRSRDQVRKRGKCDQVIGRICYWQGLEEEQRESEEDSVVTAARWALLAAFDSASLLIPGDEWIAEQKVRYLVEAGKRDEALAVAEDCRISKTWLCYALAGYTLHSFKEFAAAEGHYLQALDAMDPERRCEWTKLDLILEEEIRPEYTSLECGQRDSLESRIWWLADPLYMEPGNDRLTEHYARLTFDKMLSRAEHSYGVYWSTDIQELVIRYGWPTDWERALTRARFAPDLSILAYHPPHSGHFLPTARVLEHPFQSTAADWLVEREVPRTRYSPQYAQRIDSLAHQVAGFLRDDSTITVAAYQWFLPEADRAGPLDVALALSQGPESEIHLTERHDARLRGSLAVTAPARPLLMSLEAHDPSLRLAARARYGIEPPRMKDFDLGVSDILILESDLVGLPQFLAEAVDVGRPNLKYRSGDIIKMFWEIYHRSPNTDSLTISLSLAEGDRTVFRLVAESMGLALGEVSETPAWRSTSGKPIYILPQTVSLELPEIDDGTYLLSVEIVSPWGETVSSTREIEIVEED